MLIFRRFAITLVFIHGIGLLNTLQAQTPAKEQHRPQFHFSPREKWMNDPNGLVYYQGVYHLFYQYYPDSTIWGPMHWGHATSPDLFNWNHLPVALYPDSLGYIFSGSVVVDYKNSSGLGQDGKVPLVAIFTQHNKELETAKRVDYQNQSLAWSLDGGKSWTKYKSNPVLKNPGIVDFRDPKVTWYEKGKKWIMTLAVKDRISFYSSKDLKTWEKESEFGAQLGAHGGVWECPDLISFDRQGKQVWVLLVSINPGGPNGGSATQYFVGDFDGKTFKPFDTDLRWMDYGSDNYAGVTYFNTGSRKILIGWMSNWDYGQAVPTDKWRSAMTIPRELFVEEVNKKIFLVSKPVREFEHLSVNPKSLSDIVVNGSKDFSSSIAQSNGLFQLKLSNMLVTDFMIVLANESGDELVIGYDRKSNQYYIDRSKSGITDFEPRFARKHFAPRISEKGQINLQLIADVASVEVFADDGLTVMTDIFFPKTVISKISLKSNDEFRVKKIEFSNVRSTLK